VCFGPAALQLLLGMLVIPLTLVFGPKVELGTPLALASVVAGTLGMHALLAVVSMIISGKPSKLSPRLCWCRARDLSREGAIVYESPDP